MGKVDVLAVIAHVHVYIFLKKDSSEICISKLHGRQESAYISFMLVLH